MTPETKIQRLVRTFPRYHFNSNLEVVPPGLGQWAGKALKLLERLNDADTAEPVTPQAGIVGLDADRDDGHTMGHD